MKNKGIIIFIVVIIIIIAGFFLFNSFLKNNVIEQDTSPQEVIKEDASLIVPEQAGGTNVFIEKAFLPDGGYVVVHRAEDGKPDKIIGVSEYLQGGSSDNFLMDIDEEVVEGDILFAVLHADGNGDEKFDPLLDPLIFDNDGNPVSVEFNIVSEGALDDEVKL